MDPSAFPDQSSPSDWYNIDSPITLTPNFTQVSSDSSPPPLYVDSSKYQILQKVKDAFNTPRFLQARDSTNPFESIGRSIFMNRAAIKLANIDAVHHISNHVFTFIDKTSPSPFSFCDVAAGPGGFTQYLQYRFPNSIGYGMTLKHQTLDWNTKSLDMSRFSPFYGPDNTGNLYTNWNHFIDFVLAEQPNGVDLVTADGGFDLEEGDKTLLHKQEFLSSRLLLTQSLIGIACTKLNGNFVLKTFDTVTSISAHVLFILSLCFNRIIIFKPISSRPANAESYLLCIGRKPDIQQYYQLLSDAANLYTDDLFLSTLFSDDLPASFTNWLYSSNTRSLDRQLSSAQHILLYINGQSPTIPSYDTRKFLLMWNLPDTPPNPRYTFIKV